HLPETASGLLAHARVNSVGEILFLTKEQMAWQRGQGQLLCPDCGQFFVGERGLQDHQRKKHCKAVTEALDVVHWSRLQLVPLRTPVTPPPTPSKGTRVHLDEGLRLAAAGDVKALAALLREGGDGAGLRKWDLQTCDQHGSNALLWAAGGGHLETCQLLVAEGLDPTSQQKDRRTALHWAARNGHLSVCRWLVEVCGLDPDDPTRDGTVPLHWAVWQEHEEVCSWLLEARANLHAKNKYGCNASQWAALAGSVKMCRWLQREGLDLKLLNFNGHSALHKAAVKGGFDCCRWLLRADEEGKEGEGDGGGLGLEQLRPDRDGHRPSTMARCGGFEELSRWLQSLESELDAQTKRPDLLKASEDAEFLHQALTSAVGPRLFYQLPKLTARYMRKIALSPGCLEEFQSRSEFEERATPYHFANALIILKAAGETQAASELFEEARAVAWQGQRPITWDSLQQTPAVHISGLTHRPFWDPTQLPLAQKLKDHFPIIQQELLALRQKSVSYPAYPNLVEQSGVWDMLQLYVGRQWNEDAC
ncbi:Ankrd28, partial [Symbiodinium necroappetens]